MSSPLSSPPHLLLYYCLSELLLPDVLFKVCHLCSRDLVQFSNVILLTKGRWHICVRALDLKADRHILESWY